MQYAIWKSISNELGFESPGLSVHSASNLELAIYRFVKDIWYSDIMARKNFGDFASKLTIARGPLYKQEEVIICEVGKLSEVT